MRSLAPRLGRTSRRALAVLVTLAACAAPLSAQTVGGVAQDVATKKALPKLRVILVRTSDAAVVAEDTTREQGQFFLDATPGKYFVAFANAEGELLANGGEFTLVQDSTITRAFLIAPPAPVYDSVDVSAAPVRGARPASLMPPSGAPAGARTSRGPSCTGPKRTVSVELVVDTFGRVEPLSIRLIEGDSLQFAKMLPAALMMHYTPAVKDGHAVRQRLTGVDLSTQVTMQSFVTTTTMAGGAVPGGRRSTAGPHPSTQAMCEGQRSPAP